MKQGKYVISNYFQMYDSGFFDIFIVLNNTASMKAESMIRELLDETIGALYR
jgi:hypothetical protein